MISMYSAREQAADRRNHSPEAERYRREHGFAYCAICEAAATEPAFEHEHLMATGATGR